MKCKLVVQSCEPPVEVQREERRRYPRYTCFERVRIDGDGAIPFRVDGLLLDAGAVGFRMTHQCWFLQRGQEVDFEYTGRKGRARVVWNRILPDRIETGFKILA